MPYAARPANASFAAPRRLRPANPRCRGGASSVLRLTQPTAARLPAALDMAEWLGRADADAAVLLLVTGPHAGFVVGAAR